MCQCPLSPITDIALQTKLDVMMRLKSLLTFVLFAAGMLMLMSAMTGRSRVSTLGYAGLWVGAVTTIVLAAVLKVEKLSDVVRS